MDDTDHSVSQQTPSVLQTSHGAFDYGDLDAEKAQVLRDAAGAIQNIQHAAIADVGRHLSRAREVLDHGQFLKWADAELGIKPRSAQNYMAAAKFLEGKCATVAHLPPGILYKLSASSAPADVVAAVVAASMTDAPMPVSEIAERLAEAREEEKAIQQEIARAKQALSREAAKERIAKRKAELAAADAARAVRLAKRERFEAEVRQRKEGREERITRVIENIAKSLTDENLVELVDCINEGRQFVIAILRAEQNSRIPLTEDKPVDPTDWKNKRDYCLTRTAVLTGVQQAFVAGLHGNPSAEQLAKLEHIHGTARRVQP